MKNLEIEYNAKNILIIFLILLGFKIKLIRHTHIIEMFL